MRIAINGFGRIGRAVFRIADALSEVEVVAINDLFDPAALRYLLNYDTVMGRFPGDVRIDGDRLITPGGETRTLQNVRPRNCPGASWASMPLSRRRAYSGREPRLPGILRLGHAAPC